MTVFLFASVNIFKCKESRRCAANLRAREGGEKRSDGWIIFIDRIKGRKKTHLILSREIFVVIIILILDV